MTSDNVKFYGTRAHAARRMASLAKRFPTVEFDLISTDAGHGVVAQDPGIPALTETLREDNVAIRVAAPPAPTPKLEEPEMTKHAIEAPDDDEVISTPTAEAAPSPVISTPTVELDPKDVARIAALEEKAKALEEKARARAARKVAAEASRAEVARVKAEIATPAPAENAEQAAALRAEIAGLAAALAAKKSELRAFRPARTPRGESTGNSNWRATFDKAAASTAARVAKGGSMFRPGSKRETIHNMLTSGATVKDIAVAVNWEPATVYTGIHNVSNASGRKVIKGEDGKVRYAA